MYSAFYVNVRHFYVSVAWVIVAYFYNYCNVRECAPFMLKKWNLFDQKLLITFYYFVVVAFVHMLMRCFPSIVICNQIRMFDLIWPAYKICSDLVMNDLFHYIYSDCFF